MIELTIGQREAIEGESESPPLVIDPVTRTKYFLVREDVFNRVKRLFDEDVEPPIDPEITRHVMEVFGREGWDDPAMDVYNDLDPRRQA